MASILRPHFAGMGTSEPGSASPLRRIVHVDLDCFFVSVERVLNPSLAQAPVIVGGDAETRGVVTSASREARAFGVHAGMPTAHARRLCPEAVFLPGRGRLYGRAASAAQRILAEFAPEIERSSIDEAYLDVSASVERGKRAIEIATEIQEALEHRLELPSSIGIGSNKLIAKVACQRAKPEGIVEVFAGHERAFLGPLPVGDLPGVGPVLEERLRLFGLRTISDVSRVDASLLEATFGATGRRLAEMARGIDEDAVASADVPRSIGREHTFPRDVRDADRLVEELYVLSGTVGARLRHQGLRSRTITLKLRTGAFRTMTRSRTLPAPTDEPSEIAGIACFLLREAHAGEPIRLVGVQASGLSEEPAQGDLFAGSATEGGSAEDPPGDHRGAASHETRPPGIPVRPLHEARLGGLTVRWRV